MSEPVGVPVGVGVGVGVALGDGVSEMVALFDGVFDGEEEGVGETAVQSESPALDQKPAPQGVHVTWAAEVSELRERERAEIVD